MTDVVDQIMTLMDAAFAPEWGEKWTRSQVASALLIANTSAIIIDAEGTEVTGKGDSGAGFALTRHAAGEEELLLIAVHPDFRRSGLGRRLIQMLGERARHRGIGHIFLQMRANNPAAHLYESCGFAAIGMRKQYYRTTGGDRLDAITYALAL